MSSPLLFIFYIFLVLTPPFDAAISSGRRIKVKLIHIDSHTSPHRRTYESVEHRDKIWDEISKRRLLKMYLESKDTELNDSDVYSRLTLDPTGVFLANVAIGTPLKPQLLTIDTGSNLMWVTCGHSNFQAGDYDYRASNTSSVVSCSDYECGLSPETHCLGSSPHDGCYFQLTNTERDEPAVNGTMVYDSFTVDAEHYGFDSVAFGCATVDRPVHNENFTGTGVMGLSSSHASIAYHYGDSFSYCIGNIFDRSYEYNSLTLGIGFLLGDSTPVLKHNFTSKFYIKLRSIAVDGELLPIDPILFDLEISHGGTILDSGSTTTYLADDAFDVLYGTLKQKMNSTDDFLCVKNLRPYQVPLVEFIFEEGATLTLGMGALFSTTSPGLYCFTRVQRTSAATGITGSRNLTLIGINAQQYHNIGYDYSVSRIYISHRRCDYY